MTPIQNIIKDTRTAMERAVDSTKREFHTVHAGKASPSMLDTVRVEMYGTTMSMNQVATVSAPEPRLLLVTPFDKVEVRKALNMAINKQAIVDAVFQGAATPAKNPIPPTMWSYNDAVEDDPYDPEAARKILEEEGVTDLSMNIWAMPVQRPYNPNARRMAELIQNDWAQIGVDARRVAVELDDTAAPRPLRASAWEGSSATASSNPLVSSPMTPDPVAYRTSRSWMWKVAAGKSGSVPVERQ